MKRYPCIRAIDAGSLWRAVALLAAVGFGLGASSAGRASGPEASIWRPAPLTTWQWELDAPVDRRVRAQVFDIDLFDNAPSVVASLHAKGRQVIAYVNVGSWENWRPDAGAFPPEVLGKDYVGWPGEKWLDIRRMDLLGPIMRQRLDLAKAKGFDAIEPDNIDGYSNDTGFPLSYEDQLTYNRWLAYEAHSRGLSIGLKNDSDQVGDLEPFFDWALTEDCFAQGWCDAVLPFVQDGKAVFVAEYTDTGMTLAAFCPRAKRAGFSGILKQRELTAWRRACR